MERKILTYKIVLFFLFISSLHPWFVWNVKAVYISIVAALCSFYVARAGIITISSKALLCSSLYLFLLMWIKRGANLFGIVEIGIDWYIFLNILGLDSDKRKETVAFITKYTAIILAVALPFFAVHVMGVPLPHYSVLDYSAFHNIDNYYLFVTKGSSPRFQGPFLEPGFLTMGIAFLLFLNKYNLKDKYVLILFISQILSLSIAGYILLVFGYLVMLLFDNTGKRMIRLLYGVITIAAAMLLLSGVFGQETLKNSVFERLQWEDGRLSGDDRSSEYLDYVYDQIQTTGLKWVGTEWDSELSEKGVAGYKLYIVRYGYIGVITAGLLFLSFLLFCGNRYEKKWQLLLTVFTILMLYQNAYPTMWAVLIMLVYGCDVLTNNKDYYESRLF